MWWFGTAHTQELSELEEQGLSWLHPRSAGPGAQTDVNQAH